MLLMAPTVAPPADRILNYSFMFLFAAMNFFCFGFF